MSTKSPIACDLSSIGENQRDRHRRNAKTVFESIGAICELEDGYAFRLPADTELIRTVSAFVARERLCCPFFDFTLTIPSERQPVWLALRGREGVKAYVERSLLPKLDAKIESLNEKHTTS